MIFKLVALSVAFLLLGLSSVSSQTPNCTNKKPKLNATQTWVASPGCPEGNTYNTPTNPQKHCHCWSHCGYICEPKKGNPSPPPPPPPPSSCTNKPTVPAGSKWVPDPGCPDGPTYNTPTNPPYHCHCWSHCGYICDPKKGPSPPPPPPPPKPTTTKKPAPTTKPACKKPSSIPPGSKWVSDPGCNNGPTYNTPTNPPYHCHCWGHCGYICDPKKGGGGGTTTKAPATTTVAGSKCPFGSPWIPPSDPTKRCICKQFNHKPYYDCTTMSTTTPASTGSTTGGSSTASTGATSAGTTAGGTTAAGTTAAGTTAAGTTAAGTTAAGTTAAGTTAAGTTAAVTTAAVTTAAVTTAAVTGVTAG